MRSETESNTINRLLRARGLPTLDEPGVVPALARLVDDHSDFMKILRRCDPVKQREMYESMRPYLRFVAWPLETYIILAKEHAAAAQLPTLDSAGNLQGYTMPVIEIPEVDLLLECSKCEKQTIFCADDEHSAKREARQAGWTLDETTDGKQDLCPNCTDAMDKTPGETTAE